MVPIWLHIRYRKCASTKIVAKDPILTTKRTKSDHNKNIENQSLMSNFAHGKFSGTGNGYLCFSVAKTASERTQPSPAGLEVSPLNLLSV